MPALGIGRATAFVLGVSSHGHRSVVSRSSVGQEEGVVTIDVPANAIVGGNSAKLIKMIE